MGYLCRIIILLLLYFMLYGCSSGSGANDVVATPVVSTTSVSGGTALSVDTAALIPVFVGVATSSVVYIHNDSDEAISNINYAIDEDLVGLDNSIFHLENNCTSIAAHSSCALEFTTPILSASMNQGSALLTAHYHTESHGYDVKQLINYALVSDGDKNIVNINSTAATNNQNSYVTGYLYAGGSDQSYNVTDYSLNEKYLELTTPDTIKGVIKSHEVKAFELRTVNSTVSTNAEFNVTWQLSSLSGSSLSTARMFVLVTSTSNGAQLMTGVLPIVNVASSATGEIQILNAGNESAVLASITPPGGVTLGSGSNQCTVGMTLSAVSSCKIYFSVNQIGGSANLSVSYTGGIGGGTQTLFNNITWFNPTGGALVGMSVSPNALSFSAGTAQAATIAINNAGGYDVSNLAVVSPQVLSGSANIVNVSPLFCNPGGSSLPVSVSNSCSFTITVTDNVGDLNKYISLGISGNYVTGSGSSNYTRAILLPYTVIAPIPPLLFTWAGGTQTANSGGNYGIQGIESPGNVPPARSGSMTWIDESSNLWIFGGVNSSNSNYYNDLWRYNHVSKMWAWMSGSNQLNQTGNSGALGIESSTNMPSSRNFSAAWRDNSNNLWLFGGNQAAGFRNDLWRYNINNGRWTWMSGSSSTATQNSNYGTPGISNTTPGTRGYTTYWTDESGNFWLFGGQGQFPGAPNSLGNDLWKYNVTNNQWSWMGGSQHGNQPGNYGIQGVESAGNVPPPRNWAAGWVDPSGRYLWLFGGLGLSSINTTSNAINDLWRYNISTGNWAWIGGSSTSFNQAGIYGTRGVEASSNQPGGRYGSLTFVDESGGFWLFGGLGYQTSNQFFGALNDWWYYNRSTGNWTWVSGSGVVNVSSTSVNQGVESTANILGGKFAAAGGFQSESKFFWIFGGISGNVGSPAFNDLWQARRQ